jgi:ABC-type lipoprotein release transport system permease subunit
VVSLKLDRDGATLAGLAGVFIAVALVAVLLPAWRAATVEPMESLRSE